MSKIGLTPQELDLIHGWARSKPRLEFGMYAPLVCPVTLFAMFGLLTGDSIAIGLAFFSLLGGAAWDFRLRAQAGKIFYTISKKIAAFEGQDSSPDTIAPESNGA